MLAQNKRAAIPQQHHTGDVAQKASGGAGLEIQQANAPGQACQSVLIAVKLLPGLRTGLGGLEQGLAAEQLHQKALVLGRLHHEPLGAAVQGWQHRQLAADHQSVAQQGREGQGAAVLGHPHQGDQRNAELSRQA